MTNLSPPKNVKKIHPRCCANCAYKHTDEDSIMHCERTDYENPWGDETDIHYTVCDGFKWNRHCEKEKNKGNK